MQQTDDRLIAVVLGGTEPHIELIKQLKARGYSVVLIDYLEHPAARDFADIHERESTLDAEAVLKVVQKYNASLVISACIDQANSICCYVAEKLGLPHPYSYDTSLLVTVKSKMKKRMLDYEIPTSWYYPGRTLEDIPWNSITFPAVVKPVDCNSSKGVRNVGSLEEAKKCFEEALTLSRSGEALIEGFVEGVEIQVDCFSDGKETKVVLTREKKQIARDLHEEMNSQGSVLPSPICQGIDGKIKDIGKKISEAFELGNTPFFYQAIVDKDKNVYVLEFAPRVGGGLSYYLLSQLAGFNAVGAVIDSYIGIPCSGEIKKLDKYYGTNLLYMEEGVFDHIVGFDDVKAKGLIKESFVSKCKGTLIGSDLRSGNRVGAFIVEADTLEELKKKESEVFAIVDVIDSNGESKIRRWR